MYRQTLGKHLGAVGMVSKDAHRKRFLVLLGALYDGRKPTKSRGIVIEDRLKNVLANYMYRKKFPVSHWAPEHFFHPVMHAQNSVAKVVYTRKPNKLICGWQVRRNLLEAGIE